MGLTVVQFVDGGVCGGCGVGCGFVVWVEGFWWVWYGWWVCGGCGVGSGCGWVCGGCGVDGRFVVEMNKKKINS